MLDRFDGNKTLALAAYNGGPHNVNRWLRRNSGVSADLWTELITYGETREYVQAVLSYAIIYRELTGGTPLLPAPDPQGVKEYHPSILDK